MKINKTWVEIIIFVILYLSAIYIWTLPLQNNKLPYGEFDAISHVEVADYMAVNDKSLVYLPHYIDFRYGTDNLYKPHTLWYHPPYHTDFAIMQIIAGERVVPIYLMNTIFSTAVLISVYFVIRALFGFLPAILSSLLLIFSPRDFLPFLWGQWPERLSYAFVPLILYCFYKYYLSYAEGKEKLTYLYLTLILFVIGFYMHPLVAFHSIFGLIVLSVFLFIKERKIPFNFKHLFLSFVIIIIMLAIFPYQTENVFVRFVSEESEAKAKDFSRLFHWSPNPEDFRGSVPEAYFSFKEMHGLWTLPFLLLGILFLTIRRERRDLFLLAWLISLYLVLHRDLFGKATFLHRSLSATAHIFAPLTAIGAIYLPSFIKIKPLKNYLKYAIVILFVILTLSINGRNIEILKNAYQGLSRINPVQYEASLWVKENVPETYNVSVVGVPDPLYKQLPWMAIFSQRLNRHFESFTGEEIQQHLLNDYIFIDYTNSILLNDQAKIKNLQEFESTTLKNFTLLYNKNNIRIYKYQQK